MYKMSGELQAPSSQHPIHRSAFKSPGMLQAHLITRFAQQWNLTDSKGYKTPMEQNMHLSPFEGAAERLDDSGIQEFQSKESSLMHFAFTFEMMLNFRPSNLQDICKNLAGKNHMKVANRVVATCITRENSWGLSRLDCLLRWRLSGRSDLGYILNSGLAGNWTWGAIWCRCSGFLLPEPPRVISPLFGSVLGPLTVSHSRFQTSGFRPVH
jgi:hypothetical protein